MAKRKKKVQKKQDVGAQFIAPAASSSADLQKPTSGRSKWIGIAILVLAAISGIAFFTLKKGNALTAGQYKDYNILLITLDTTRADHLPAYGYTKVKTPNLDKLASRSLIFEDAISHAPLTLPAHTSILTGLLPITHGVRDNGGYFVDPKDKTVAEVFKGKGYTTSAFVSAYVLISKWGLGKGFDFYYDDFNQAEYSEMNPRDIQRRGDETELEVEHWLDANKGKKFFSWIHLFDPHDPYEPPEPYRTEYKDIPYDGEIAFTDQVLGRLFDKLEQLQLKDRTIIVITGDHGEALGEHHEMTHSMFVYNATVHVPLLVYLPGTKGKRISGTVRHIDIAPTLLELAGISSLNEMQGASMLPMVNGSEKKGRAAYSESTYAETHYGWSPLYSLATEQYRFIDAPKPELYDREADPGEVNNLISEKSSIAKVLRNDLRELMVSETRQGLKGPQKMDPDTEEKLRALGYLSGGVQATEESRKIDPKDKIHLTTNIQLAYSACMDKNYKKAIEFITPVLQEDASMLDGHFLAGIAYGGAGEYQLAIDQLMKTITVKPDHVLALYNLGYAYQALGDPKTAEFWYKKTLEMDSKNTMAMMKLAALYSAISEPEKAKPYFEEVIRFYDTALSKTNSVTSRAALYTTLGEIYFSAGNLVAAEKSLNSAMELAPGAPNLHYNLAQIYEAKGQPAQALESYKKEIEINPSNFKAFNNLGLLYQQRNMLNDAVLCFQKVIQLDSQNPQGYVLLASSYKQMGKEQEAFQTMQKLQSLRKN